MKLEQIYYQSPIFVQNIGVSLYGAYVKRRRYAGAFWRYVDWLIQNEQKSRSEIEVLQNGLLLETLQRAYRDVPYYQKTWTKHGISPNDLESPEVMRRLPLLRKEDIRNDPAAFISRAFRPSELIPYPTGGTSGSSLVLRYTIDQIRFNFAFGEARIRRWAGTSLGERAAVFLGKPVVPPSQNKPPYWRRDFAQNLTIFSIFHLNQHTADDYIRELERIGPRIIIGYVTPLHHLSKFIIQRGGISCKPRLIWTSSETLFGSQRSDIEKAFGCPVNNAYSSAEGVTFISQCKYGCLHLSPEFGFTELKPVGSDLYEIVGTTLFNHSMPLIRYATGDLVRKGTPHPGCMLPFPVVGDIIGRMDDVIVTPSGTFVGGAALSLVFSTTPEVYEAQLIQPDVKTVVVRLVPSGSTISSKTLGTIQERLRMRLGEMKIKIEQVPSIARTSSGKFRFIISTPAREIENHLVTA